MSWDKKGNDPWKGMKDPEQIENEPNKEPEKSENLPANKKNALGKALKITAIWAAPVFAITYPVTRQFEDDPNYRLGIQLVATLAWLLVIFLGSLVRHTIKNGK